MILLDEQQRSARLVRLIRAQAARQPALAAPRQQPHAHGTSTVSMLGAFVSWLSAVFAGSS